MLKILTITLAITIPVHAAYADIVDGEELVDPTRPLFLSSVTSDETDVDVAGFIRSVVPSSYDVSFIRASGSTPMAVVNSERVTVGDTIGGAEVIEIGRNSVTLLINGEERTVSIFDTALKTRAQN